MGQDFHFTEDTCGGGMSRRGSGAVQREWVRCSAASSVVLNNAARVEERRPAPSPRRRQSRYLGDSRSPDRRLRNARQEECRRSMGSTGDAQVTTGTVARPSRWGSLSGQVEGLGLTSGSSPSRSQQSITGSQLHI